MAAPERNLKFGEGKIQLSPNQRRPQSGTKEAVRIPIEVDGRPFLFTVTLGSITEAPTDAILCPSNPSFGLAMGGVENAIRRDAGSEPFDAADKYMEQFDREKGVSYAAAKAFPSGRLAERGIKQIIFSNVLPEHQDLTSEMVAQCIGQALLEADKAGAKSLAVPAIGTGFIGAIQGFSMQESIEGTLKGIAVYEALRQESGLPKATESLSLVLYAQANQNNASEALKMVQEAINRLPNVKKSTDASAKKEYRRNALTPREELLMSGVEQVIESKEKEVRELLARHTGLVSADTINQIVEKEIKATRDDYRRKRLEGKANDQWSYEKPGITVVVSTKVKDALLEICEKAAYPRQEAEEVAEGIWYLKFPKGLYSAGGGGMQFYLEPGREKGQPMYKAKYPLATPYNDVIRVEGEGNYLWQNTNYNWDGTPKNK